LRRWVVADKFYLVPAEWFERAKVADSMDKINLVDELLKAETVEYADDETTDHSGTSQDRGYIDWGQAPSGATHCFSHTSQEQSNPEPDEPYMWEKWVGNDIYEWTSEEEWVLDSKVSNLDAEDKANRVKRP
jgi:hypothetical protein